MKSKRIFYGEKWYNRPKTSLSRLLREKTSNHHEGFYCLNCNHSYSTKIGLKRHGEKCNKHNDCHVEMPKEYEKALKYNHGEKSLKAPFVIYFDNEVFFLKINSSQNNPEESYTEKEAKHIPSGCACSLTCFFDSTKNKNGYFRGEDCIKRLCEKFIELVLEIINYEENEMIPLIDEDIKFYEEQKNCHICKEGICDDENDKNKVRDHCHYTKKFRGAAHSIFNIRYKVPKEIPIIAHNATYDHHFIIKQLG